MILVLVFRSASVAYNHRLLQASTVFCTSESRVTCSNITRSMNIEYIGIYSLLVLFHADKSLVRADL